MDSGNSGSMNSSSGGEEELDSRSDSITSFFSSSGLSSNQQQPPPLFDPLSTYLDVFSRPPPSAANSLLWPTAAAAAAATIPSPSAQLLPAVQQGSVRAPLVGSASSDPHNNAAAGRNPKKRSRASRRAPTTVLTTDTSNFRAMVQEFTGIPAPPFSAGSPFQRSRLDLFGAGSGLTLPPSYLLRPFAHKLQQPVPSFVSHSNIGDHNTNIASTTTTTTTNPTISITGTTTASNSTSNSNYQRPSELGLHKQPAQNLVLNMQSTSTDHHDHHPSMLSFQSLLQSPNPKHTSPNVPIFGLKSQGSSLTIPSHVELGGASGTHHLGHGLSNLVNSSDGISLRSSGDINWATEGVGSNDGDHHQSHLRGLISSGNLNNIGSNSSQRVNSSCKMNFSASSSDFHADKGSENVPSRGEGMVGSWICPSD